MKKAPTLERIQREHKRVQRVNVDFPIDFLRELDAEATRIGVSRQAFIKYVMAQAVQKERTRREP
jgi:metal-responsive CopG/Arc/MetJ family transcriptional regulator